MKLIFVGPQGSGKGTQAKKVAKKFGLCHISVGDLLRGTEGEMKKKIDVVMNKGELVPNEFVEKLLLEKISNNECKKGYILDGYPRDESQLDFCEKNFEIDKVIEISISDDEAVRRICGRRVCLKCGAIYNVVTSLFPKVEGICDKCGAELVQRKDDNEEALRERLKIYHEKTIKIFKSYDSVKIDGSKSIEKVFEDIIKVLS
jgi:adenylate kinase